jgi:hypothetical protein
MVQTYNSFINSKKMHVHNSDYKVFPVLSVLTNYGTYNYAQELLTQDDAFRACLVWRRNRHSLPKQRRSIWPP